MPERIPKLAERLDGMEADFKSVTMQRDIALVCAFFCLLAAIAGITVAVNARSVAQDSQAVAEQLHVSQLEACERGNESRVSRIANYKRDVKNARADIDFAGSFAPVLPATGPLAVWTDRKIQVIDGKRESIMEEVGSIQSIAIQPGSPVVDCSLAYPK